MIEAECPVRETIVMEGEIETRTFSVRNKYGTHKTTTRGEYLDAVIDKAEVRHDVSSVALSEWDDLCAGVKTKTTSKGYRIGSAGIVEQETSVRIERDACPVVLQVRRVDRYSSDAFNESSTDPYAIVVSAAEPDG